MLINFRTLDAYDRYGYSFWDVAAMFIKNHTSEYISESITNGFLLFKANEFTCILLFILYV